jgi:hypothetical protein
MGRLGKRPAEGFTGQGESYVRSHAKASSAGSNTRQGRGLGRTLLSALAAIVAVMALGAASAGATTTHFFLENFGSAAQPEFSEPGSIAVDESNGDLLVIDTASRTVSRYKADGTPDDFSALGTNVIDGEGIGDGTPQGGLLFLHSNSNATNQVAVDDSGGLTDGNIYVTQTFNFPSVGGAVDVFSSSGQYLGQLTEYEEGAGAAGPAAALGPIGGVAVAPNGSVYVSERLSPGLIHKYVPSTGVPVNADNVANFAFEDPTGLAVGTGPTAGFIFAVIKGAGASYDLAKIDAATGEIKYLVERQVEAVSVDPATGDVYAAMDAGYEGPHSHSGFTHFDASGAASATLVTYVRADGETTSVGVAVRGSNGHVFLSAEHLHVLSVYGPLLTQADLEITSAVEVSATRARMRGFVNPDGSAITECKFEYGTVESGMLSNALPCEESISTDTNEHTVSAVVSGLPANGAEYQYRLVVSNADGRTAISETETFDLLTRIATSGSSGVTSHSATVHGLLRPEAEAVEDCRFEYGPSTSYGASVPCSPAAGSIAQDFATDAVSGALESLEEDTVYHYRLSFTTPASTFTGGDQHFRTRSVSTGLPDDRRYEMVSPTEKNHSDVGPTNSIAALDGNRLVFSSNGSFAGAQTSQVVVGLQYLATRGPNGWNTENIDPAGGEFTYMGYTAFSSDLSKGALYWPENNLQNGTVDPDAKPGYNDYLREAGNPSFTLLNGTRDDAGGESFQHGSVVSASADFRHLAIASPNPLTADAPAEPGECDGHLVYCTYEWDDGTLRLASILPSGEPTAGTPGALGYHHACSSQHAMSGDGSRLFFTPASPNAPLYARENATTTTLISESERTLPGGFEGQRVDYQNAEAAHGNRVLFTTRNSLLDEDTDETNDLYLYDYARPAGERLTLISRDEDPSAPEGAEVDGGAGNFDVSCGGVMGASEDLRRVYFVADNQIVSGEPEEAGPKLYLWDDTGTSPTVTYIGTLKAGNQLEGDLLAWQGALTYNQDSNRTARVSTDGRYLTFLSVAELGFENEGQQQVYRYDAITDTLECASCSEDAVPAEGKIAFEVHPNAFLLALYGHLANNVTDNGQVFFQTTRGLLPGDSNGKMDVYEYEGGHLRLISTGVSSANSFLLDATPSGSDVFFTTVDRLVGWDKDGNVDAYDARVNGGFPEPPEGVPPCEGDACQPAPNPPNDATPASSSFQGSGNVSEPGKARCTRGKVRHHGRCVKRRKHARKHDRHKRTATRSHG